jgi:predicted Zn-dependent peptidase
MFDIESFLRHKAFDNVRQDTTADQIQEQLVEALKVLVAQVEAASETATEISTSLKSLSMERSSNLRLAHTGGV